MQSPEARMLTFPCSRCKTLLSAPPEKAGATLICPKCRNTVVAPSGSTPQDEGWRSLLAPPQAEGELGRLGGYRILGLLGNGGMGVVLRAEDPTLGREIALKIMLPQLAAPNHRERFLREARTAAVVEHENVVTIYQIGEDRGVPFIAMQLLKGESLEARLLREKRLDALEAGRIAREIALGLGAAHERGIIHRDVKPANVWLERNTGKVKLLDFGLARETGGPSNLTTFGVPLGTPAFMAPEQVQGREIDGRADLFALGCVLYRMLTGKLAFTGHDLYTTMMSVITHQPLPPAAVRPDVPREISELVMRLLAKRPEDRIGSAAEVAQALAGTDAHLAWPTPVEGGAMRQTPAPPTRPEKKKTQQPAWKPTKTTKPARPVKTMKPPQRMTLGKKLVLTSYVLLALAVAAAVVGLLIVTAMEAVEDDPDRQAPPGKEHEPDRDGPGKKDGKAKDRGPRGKPEKGKPAKGGGEGKAGMDRADKGKVAKVEVEKRPLPRQLVIESGRGQGDFRMEFVLIPATGEGGFQMGATAQERRRVLADLEETEEPAWLKAESPRHKVVLSKPFYLGKYEVTQKQYAKVMGANPSYFRKGGGGEKLLDEGQGTGDFPVDSVTWYDALKFLEKLNDLPEARKMKGRFRLPTEAQWEYACRGGPDVEEPFTFARPSASISSERANFEGVFPFGGGKAGKCLNRTCKVGSYEANPFGLYDMHGNVWEWCLDTYKDGAYDAGGRRDPVGSGPGERVIRGGGWSSTGRLCRSACRSRNDPTSSLEIVGFRVAFVPSD
jgi:serine/threonine protein kinase/formylglycine-generating enzyme required for sulfatase activity